MQRRSEIEDRTTDDTQINYKVDPGYIFGVRTSKNVWWGNQGILGVGNRHDNTAYCSFEEVVHTTLQGTTLQLK